MSAQSRRPPYLRFAALAVGALAIGVGGVSAPAFSAVTSTTTAGKPIVPVFAGSSRVLTAKERKAMTPSVWRPGCPVSLDDIRRVEVSFWNDAGKVKTGAIDVRADVADDVVEIFHDLFLIRFPIKKIVPIEAYGGNDSRSIDDDNTSAFNCRAVTGGTSFSQHSYGIAIDLNPFRNPYVNNGKAQNRPGSAKYLNRDPTVALPGVIYADGPVVRAFAKRGWKWGGDWTNPKDYQHFSLNGR